MIELTDWLRRNLLLRADAEAPRECCGLIGRGKSGLGLYAALNDAADPCAGFRVAAEDQLAILHEMENRGETLAGLYHSHPSGVAAPSEADLDLAMLWPGLTWVIVAPGGEPEFWVGALT